MEENEKKKIIVKAKTNTTISEIAKKQIEESKYPVVGAIFNNEYKNLDDELQEDGTLELININSKEGMKIYRRTLTYIMGMAFWKLYPEARVVVNYQLTNAMYCNLENMKVTEEMLYNVQEEMKRIVEKDLKIEKRTMTREEAGKFYEKNNTGKGRLQYDLSTNEKINMSYCEDYFNYFYEIIATHTGVTKIFELKKYYDGFLLRYPSSQDVNVLPEYEETKKLSWALHEYETIYKVLNVGTVYRLNKRVKEGSIKELILLSEALHEKKIAQIADKIAQRKGVKMVLIAGPSSSGKTTFAQRLGLQLRINGIKPVTISVDNYFVERDQTPRNEKGEYDFEDINAIDIDLFNDQLLKLLNGEEVETPSFNFHTGHKEYRGDKLKLNKNDVLVGMDGNFHMNFWHDNIAYLNQRCVRLRAHSDSTISSIQILHSIKPYIKAKEQNAKGSTVGHLSDKDLKGLHLIKPLKTRAFNPRKTLDGLLALVIENKKQILSLTKQRDELLPLLINGQITIE